MWSDTWAFGELIEQAKLRALTDPQNAAEIPREEWQRLSREFERRYGPLPF